MLCTGVARGRMLVSKAGDLLSNPSSSTTFLLNILLNGLTAWSPSSLDFNPLDFYFVGPFKANGIFVTGEWCGNFAK